MYAAVDQGVSLSGRQIILARRGQGKFRERVSHIEHACRITGVNRPEYLIASHCKPWRDCESLRRMGIPPDERRNVGGFTEGQRSYLEFHREAVFLEARVKTWPSTRTLHKNQRDVNLRSYFATSSWHRPGREVGGL
jgi:hypothetical protein